MDYNIFEEDIEIDLNELCIKNENIYEIYEIFNENRFMSKTELIFYLKLYDHKKLKLFNYLSDYIKEKILSFLDLKIMETNKFIKKFKCFKFINICNQYYITEFKGNFETKTIELPKNVNTFFHRTKLINWNKKISYLNEENEKKDAKRRKSKQILNKDQN